MRIVIVGPGALGCLFTCRLARKAAADAARDMGQNEIILLDHRPERAATLSRSGLLFHEIDGSVTRVYPPVTASPEEIGKADLLLVCVKSTVLADCLAACRNLFAASALTVFIQNGISHLDIAESETFPMAFASTTEGANLVATGEARHAGRGQTYLGFLHAPGAAAVRLAGIAEYFSPSTNAILYNM
jgi:2-dehydropantoate 2-reductase